MLNAFYFEYGQENDYNDRGQKSFDPMEDILTQIKDSNIVLETVTSRQAYLTTPRPKKTNTAKETAVESEPKLKKQTPKLAYNNYSDRTRETFIHRIL